MGTKGFPTHGDYRFSTHGDYWFSTHGDYKFSTQGATGLLFIGTKEFLLIGTTRISGGYATFIVAPAEGFYAGPSAHHLCFWPNDHIIH